MKPGPVIQKAIWIEYRKPFTKYEKSIYGQTFHTGNGHTARIFINTTKNKTNRNLTMTLWHELFHVFCSFTQSKLTKLQEEDHAQRLERIVWELIR